MKRSYVGVLSCMICVTVVATGARAADCSSAIGHWNVTITNGDEKIYSWMDVRHVDGKHKIDFLSEVGGKYDAGEATIEGNTISFKSIAMDVKENPKPWYAYTGTIDGDTMSGTRKLENKSQPWTAKRIVRQACPVGTWKIAARREGAPPATLEITREGQELSGKIRGRQERPISGVKLAGDTLTFSSGTGERVAQYEAKIKGDVMEGTVRRGDREPAPFTAQREHTWGEPIELFNGKDMTGWKPLPGLYPSKWQVVDGIFMTPEGGANIVTEQKFKDFKLHVEFRVPPHGNSGVYLRGRYEIQIEDSHGRPPQASGCGAMYSRIIPSANPAKPASEWQTYDATLIGQYLTLVFNDVKVIDNALIEGMTGGALDNHDDEPGPIYLQGDHGKIEFRKITLTPVVKK